MMQPSAERVSEPISREHSWESGSLDSLAATFFDAEHRVALERIQHPSGKILTPNGEKTLERLLAEARSLGWELYGTVRSARSDKEYPVTLPCALLPIATIQSQPRRGWSENVHSIRLALSQLVRDQERVEEEPQSPGPTEQPQSLVEDPLLDRALTYPSLRAYVDGYASAALRDGDWHVAVYGFESAGTVTEHREDIRRVYHDLLGKRLTLNSWQLNSLERAKDILSWQRDETVPAVQAWLWPELQTPTLSPEAAAKRADLWEGATNFTAETLLDLIHQDGVYVTHTTAYPLEAIEHGALWSTTAHNVRQGRSPSVRAFLHPSETIHCSVNEAYYQGAGLRQRDDTRGSRLKTLFLTHPGVLLSSHLAQRPWSQWCGEPMYDTGFRGTSGQFGEAEGDAIPMEVLLFLVPKYEPVDQETGRPVRESIHNQTNQPVSTAVVSRWREQGVVTAEEYWTRKLTALRQAGRVVPTPVYYTGESYHDGLADFERSYQIPPVPNVSAFQQVLRLFEETPVPTTAQDGQRMTYYRYARQQAESNRTDSDRSIV